MPWSQGPGDLLPEKSQEALPAAVLCRNPPVGTGRTSHALSATRRRERSEVPRSCRAAVGGHHRKSRHSFSALGSPPAKIHFGIDERRRAAARLRPRRLARYLFHQRSHARNGEQGRKSAQRALPQQPRRHLYRRHRQGRSCKSLLRHGRRGWRLQQRRLARHLRNLPGRKCSLPQQWRRNIQRRHREGRRGRWALVYRRSFRRLRRRRLRRPDGGQLRRVRSGQSAGVRQGHQLQVQGNRRAVRPARAAGFGRLAVSQQRRRHVYERLQERGRRRSQRLLRPGRDLGRLQQHRTS